MHSIIVLYVTLGSVGLALLGLLIDFAGHSALKGPSPDIAFIASVRLKALVGLTLCALSMMYVLYVALI